MSLELVLKNFLKRGKQEQMIKCEILLVPSKQIFFKPRKQGPDRTSQDFRGSQIERLHFLSVAGGQVGKSIR